MTVVDTSTASAASAYSNQRKVDRTSTGRLWACVDDGTDLLFWYSDDEGSTWTQNASAALSGASEASFTIDADDHGHVVYRSGNTIRYAHMESIGTSTSWNTGTSFTSDSTFQHPDLAVHREGSGWMVHIVCSRSDSANYVYRARVTVSSAFAQSRSEDLTLLASSNNLGHTFPSVDFYHTGDGKTVQGSTPHIFVAWSHPSGTDRGVRCVKGTYSGGSWTWGTERPLDSTNNAASGLISSAFDGSRLVVAYVPSSDPSSVLVKERDAADTATTSRAPTALSDGTVEAVSVSYDSDENIHLGAVGATSSDVKTLTYDRVAGTWGAWSTVATADALADSLSLERGYSDSRIGIVYTDGTAAPYDVAYESLVLNRPPNAPTLTNPVGGATVDRTATVRFSWDFSDPDVGDSQSQFDLQIRPQGSATLSVDTSSTIPNEYHDLASGTLAADDYEWRVRTYDSQGEVAPWSGWEPFTAADPPSGPSITDPTSGQTIPTEDYTVVWSVPNQDGYQLRRVADDGGVPDETTVYFDTGTVNSASARSRTVNFETNGRWEHVQLRVLKDGLWSSPWVSTRVFVSYTVPATPTVTVVEDDPAGAMSVLVDQGDWPVDVSTPAYTGTGDGTMTGPTATDGTTDTHDWQAECVTAATDGGTFDVTVDGTVVGQAEVGVEFTYEGLSFTINDGATDFTVGDTFTWSTTAVKVTSNEVWRRPVASTGEGIRVATGVARAGSFVDWAVASGVEYAYRVRAQGDNQTSAWGAWTETASESEGLYGGSYS